MTNGESTSGGGALRWNAGGWFGSVFGGTLWLFLGSGALTAADHAVAAAVWMVCTVLGVALGIVLWKRRETIAPHRAVQALVWGLFVLGVTAMVAVDMADADEALSSHAIAGGATKYAALLVFPILSLLFARRGRAER